MKNTILLSIKWISILAWLCVCTTIGVRSEFDKAYVGGMLQNPNVTVDAIGSGCIGFALGWIPILGIGFIIWVWRTFIHSSEKK